MPNLMNALIEREKLEQQAARNIGADIREIGQMYSRRRMEKNVKEFISKSNFTPEGIKSFMQNKDIGMQEMFAIIQTAKSFMEFKNMRTPEEKAEIQATAQKKLQKPQTVLKQVYGPDGQPKWVSIDKDTGKIVETGLPAGRPPEDILEEKLEVAKASRPTVNIDQRGETEFTKTSGKLDAEAKSAAKESAKNSLKVLDINRRALKLLNEGIISGKWANWKLGFSKALSSIGDTFNNVFGANINFSDEKADNTETITAVMAEQVANILASGAFGRGVAISDKDRDFVANMVAGNIGLNENSMREIIRIRSEIEIKSMENYNASIEQYKGTPNEKYYPPIKIPYEKVFKKAVNPKTGDVLYEIDGEWVRR